MIFVNEKIQIDEIEIEFSFVKASGSGGQKVNKTNSQVQLRWNLIENTSIGERTKDLLISKLSSKLTTKGELIVVSEAGRSQHQNKQDCIDKFIELLKTASFVPKPRKKTRPTRSSKEKRLKNKKIKSDLKKGRQKKY